MKRYDGLSIRSSASFREEARSALRRTMGWQTVGHSDSAFSLRTPHDSGGCVGFTPNFPRSVRCRKV